MSVYNTQEIMEILPHRHPFLLIDTIEELEPGVRAVGRKYVTFNEPYFAGHFPGHPVLPAVVQVLMAQVALEAMGQSADLACVPQAKFLAPLGPDVDILLTLSKGRREGRWECTLHSGETLAARIQVEVPAL